MCAHDQDHAQLLPGARSVPPYQHAVAPQPATFSSEDWTPCLLFISYLLVVRAPPWSWRVGPWSSLALRAIGFTYSYLNNRTIPIKYVTVHGCFTSISIVFVSDGRARQRFLQGPFHVTHACPQQDVAVLTCTDWGLGPLNKSARFTRQDSEALKGHNAELLLLERDDVPSLDVRVPGAPATGTA